MTASPSSARAPLPIWQFTTLAVALIGLIVTTLGAAWAVYTGIDNRITTQEEQADRHIEAIRTENAAQLRGFQRSIEAIRAENAAQLRGFQ